MGKLRKAFSDLFVKRGGKVVAVQERMTGRHYVTAIMSAYENLFAQVRPLINEMKKCKPYGVGRNGAEIAIGKTPEIARLFSPNDQMGWDEFMDLALATWLTENELNIRVHFNGRSVVGYTILPVGCRIAMMDGTDRFQVYSANGGAETLLSDEVITMRYSRSPRNIDRGVSPASSVFTWTQVDDMMAQFQRAYFENGAVPATITRIRASTHDKYLEVREDLEKGLKGANNSNKTLYLWTQELDDGQSADQVEIKPIQSENSKLALKDLYEIIADKLNKSVGVSNFLLGDDSSAKFTNAELSKHNFIEQRVYPALCAFWDQFQHGLDRIFAERGMGGLGYAITFNLALPELTERRQMLAQTASTNTNSLIAMIQAGAEPEAAVNALGLDSEMWLEAANGIKREKTLNKLIAPLALEATTSPFSDDSAPKRHKHSCGCEKCVKTANTAAKTQDYKPTWKPSDKAAKELYDLLISIARQIANEDASFDLAKAEEQVNGILDDCVVDGAVDGAKFLKAMALGSDIDDYLKGIVSERDFTLTDLMRERLNNRRDAVIEGFVEETKQAMQQVLSEATEKGLSENAIKKSLSESIPRTQAEVIARTETNTALNIGRYDLDQQIAQTYGLEMYLVWDATQDGACCDVCAAMHGTKVKIGEAFPASVITKDGTEVAFERSDYNLDGLLPKPHPNCKCTFNEEVVRKK